MSRSLAAALWIVLSGCTTGPRESAPPDAARATDASTGGGHAETPTGDELAARRSAMIRQLRDYGITDARVLAAMERVPRHLFVPEEFRDRAYGDHPLPIGHDQTISQPYIVAFMTEAAGIRPNDKVLEVGTGSGYQAAILAEVAQHVYSIEIVPELAQGASAILSASGYDNVEVRTGDGYVGWPEHAPFDAILVTAAPDHIPPALIEQLRVGGRMIIPVGRAEQEMLVVTKTARGVERSSVFPVRFVPLVRPDSR